MVKSPHQSALDILKAHRGELVEILLSSGSIVRAWNIAWGYDQGESVAHITTNISPTPEQPHDIDFFRADEIVRIVDAGSGTVWFQLDSARGAV